MLRVLMKKEKEKKKERKKREKMDKEEAGWDDVMALMMVIFHRYVWCTPKLIKLNILKMNSFSYVNYIPESGLKISG
jgi:hypothetical protein